MPICLAGVHRSGTSMLARLLNLCGLYLGRDEDIIKPKLDNPSGFWENIKFLSINEELLVFLKASWDLPPTASKVTTLGSPDKMSRSAAEKLIAEFEGREPWGWKDPRNTLTLPFWKSIISDLKIVVSLRNPIEVYQSMNRRGGSSYLFAITLWTIYTQHVLKHTHEAERLVTHFDSYFHDPGIEMRRVLSFCGIEASKRTIDAACSTISPSMRHDKATTELLDEAGAPPALINTYLDLCLEAGPVCEAAVL